MCGNFLIDEVAVPKLKWLSAEPPYSVLTSLPPYSVHIHATQPLSLTVSIAATGKHSGQADCHITGALKI